VILGHHHFCQVDQKSSEYTQIPEAENTNKVQRALLQAEYAITDVDIKAKLALRGTTASAKKELKDWHRSQAGT
jgi:hypothetical protein